MAKSISTVDKVLMSQTSFGGDVGDENERITIVQVGEKAREYNPEGR